MNYKKADEKTRTAFFVAFIQSQRGEEKGKEVNEKFKTLATQ